MTTTVNPAPSEAGKQADAQPSAKKKPRESARAKTVRRAAKMQKLRNPATARSMETPQPATLEDARREMLRLVCRSSAAMTKAIIDDALQGKYMSARFLFEAVGLCAMKGEEVEDIAERETLASLLLHKWQFAPKGSNESGEVTEVPEVTAGIAPERQPPVES